jgi:hypothetical protein
MTGTTGGPNVWPDRGDRALEQGGISEEKARRNRREIDGSGGRTPPSYRSENANAATGLSQDNDQKYRPQPIRE